MRRVDSDVVVGGGEVSGDEYTPKYSIRERSLSLDIVFIEAANVLDLQVPKARRCPHTSATHQLQLRRALNQLKGEGVKEVGVGGEANGEEEFHLVKKILSFLTLFYCFHFVIIEKREKNVFIRVVKRPTWGWLPSATCARSFSI